MNVRGFHYGVQGKSGAGFALALGAVAALHADKRGKDLVFDGLTGAMAPERRECFRGHLRIHFNWK